MMIFYHLSSPVMPAKDVSQVYTIFNACQIIVVSVAK